LLALIGDVQEFVFRQMLVLQHDARRTAHYAPDSRWILNCCSRACLLENSCRQNEIASRRPPIRTGCADQRPSESLRWGTGRLVSHRTLKFPLRPNEQEPFSNLALEVSQPPRNA
jgi:hypothetical protein